MAACVALATVIAPSRAEETASPRKLPVDPAAEKTLLEAGGPGMKIKRTTHFLVGYDSDADALQDFIARLEATHRSTTRFLTRLGLERYEPTERLQVLFFAQRTRFLEYAKQLKSDATGAAGFYHHATNRAAFYDARSAPRIAALNERISGLEKTLRDHTTPSAQRPELARNLALLRSERDNTVETIHQLVVQHEVAHEVFYNAGLHVPRADNPSWIVEGLACLFETPPTDRGAGLGAQNDYRLINFREGLAGERNAAEAKTSQFDAACANGRFVPLKRLIGETGLFNTQREDVEYTYAETWALTYYLQRRQTEAFGKYLVALSKRVPGKAHSPEEEVQEFESIILPLDEEFTRKWLDFILDLPVRLPQ
jgi:hypothetical protein